MFNIFILALSLFVCSDSFASDEIDRYIFENNWHNEESIDHVKLFKFVYLTYVNMNGEKGPVYCELADVCQKKFVACNYGVRKEEKHFGLWEIAPGRPHMFVMYYAVNSGARQALAALPNNARFVQYQLPYHSNINYIINKIIDKKNNEEDKDKKTNPLCFSESGKPMEISSQPDDQRFKFKFSDNQQKQDINSNPNTSDPLNNSKHPSYGRGCCSSNGGSCGCSNGRVRCCNGRISPSCLCD